MNIPALKSLPLSMLENGDHQMVTGLGSILSIKERNIDSMDELLESRVIGSRPFREVIMDDDTVLLGQD